MVTAPRSRRRPPAIFWFGVVDSVCLIVFTVLMIKGMLFMTDVTVAKLVPEPPEQRIEAIFSAIASLWSPELSLVYGLLCAVILLARGLGFWSLLPFSFLLVVPAEVATKLYILDPYMLDFVKSWAPLPIADVQLGPHVVIHGSGVRTAFLCVLGASLLWQAGSVVMRAGSVVLLLVMVAAGVARVLGRDHAFSGEVSGVLLGAGLGAMAAALLAGPMERRARRGRVHDPSPR